MASWLPALAAALLPVVLGGLGALRTSRDGVWVIVYGQALVYLFVAPAAVYSGLPIAAQGWYRVLAWQALLFFAVPATLAYALWARRATAARPVGCVALAHPPGRSGAVWRTDTLATLLVAGGSVVGAVAFCWAAVASGLFYRRIGTEALAEASADLPLVVLAAYRLFVETAPFLLALHYVVLRTHLAPGGWQRRAWVGALAATGLVYVAYIAVNSRQQFVLLLAMFACLAALTRPRPAAFRPERLMLAVMLVGVTIYGSRVIENMRDAVGEGRSAADPRNLLWQRTATLRDEESVFTRLNGLDLIVRAIDGIEAEGPALGTLWAVPAVVSLDPIVRTPQTEALKRAGLTTAKSFMLIRYAGAVETDYYSCIATDAYGNFGAAGFALIGGALAGLCAYVARVLTRRDSPAAVVAGCFVLSRVLPFEQEFGTLVFGWLKLLPVVAVIAWLFHRTRAGASASQRLAGVPA